MAKLQHTFVQGKMNKDLDERLVPNGQYRDAQNIQVSTSEGSDVGAVENILGNTIQNIKVKNVAPTPNVLWVPNFGLTNSICIGVVNDSQNEKVYWFLTSDEADAIMEFDQATSVVAPVLVDTGSILNFSASNLITGVNVLEGMLMWTDNLNEPRIINIATFKTGSSAQVNEELNTTTQVYGRSIKASDINVIKLKPETAPGVVALPSLRGGNGTGITPVTTVFNFTDSLANSNPPKEVGSTVNIVTNLATTWTALDIIVLDASQFTDTFTKLEYQVRLNVVSVVGTAVEATIASVSKDINAASYTWSCLLEEVEPFFELQFPRFAYRWKYAGNEYSAFSPFTQAVFIPSQYDYSDANAYNESMTNNLRSLTLNAFATPPADVVEVDILFKESNSPTIYKVDSIPPATSSFSITSELIYNVINSDQTIRAYDNVPRKAKSQELIGNRIVYGNYLQNYNVPNATSIVTTATSTPITTLNSPEQSIKSLRTYQLGIVYIDINGRETPVFTNASAAITIEGSASKTATVLKASTFQQTPPSSADITAFKYYIKDISNEYYNLVLDRYYDAANGNVWLSFPSAERNKVQIDDFIVLKKAHGTDEAVTETPRYKIIDISNEVPVSVSTIQRVAAKDQGDRGTQVDGVYQPIKNGISSFQINGPTRTDNPDFFEVWSSGLALSIQFAFHTLGSTTVNTSSWYDLKSGGFNGRSTTAYDVNLVNNLDEGDWITNLVSGDLLRVSIRTGEIGTSTAYEGKFFVQINRDSLFEDYVLFNFTDNIGDYNEVAGINLNQNLALNAVAPNPDPPAADRFAWLENAAYSNPAVMALPEYGVSTFGFGYAPYPGGNGFTYGSASNDAFIAAITAANAEGKIIAVRDNVGGWSTLGQLAGAASQAIVTGRGPAPDATQRAQFGITLKDFFDSELPNGAFWNRIGIFERKREQTITFNGETKPLASPNPAIFETEPSEAIDLDLYYEASDAIPINQLAAQHTLPYFNCYSYGNGVESNRIRDDFNAKVIGKGSKASSVLETVYSEEHRGAGLIYSGIFNSTSGVNELNQFIAGLKITKDLNPSYGTIQKLHARDTDLIALMEDKCFRVLADKDALYNADGNSNVTSNNNVLGQTIPFVGEYGISKNPESFASFGFRSYFTDKARGTVLRLSRDGLTDLGAKQMSYFFQDGLKTNGAADIIGAYDADIGSYNVLLGGESVSFKEQVDGWNTRMSYSPEFGISLNNEYYTFKNGELYEHSNPLRSNFYGTQYSSTVTPIFNDAPTSIKNFKTLSYEGDAGWTASIATNEQSGTVSTWKKREGLYFNYIMGDGTFFLADLDGAITNSNTIVIAAPNTNISVGDTVTGVGISGIVTVTSIAADKITITVTGSPQTLADDTALTFTKVADVDTSEFSVMGIGNVLRHDASSVEVDGEINVSLQPGDIILTDDPGNALKVVGTVLSINRATNTITLTAASPVVLSTTPPAAFILFAKNTEANTSGLLGYYGEVVLTTASSDKKELFAVNSEIFISSE